METERLLDEPESGSEESRAIRALFGGRIMRKRRMRRLLLTHLLRQGDESEDDEFEDEEGGDERETLRALIGGRAIRRNKLRRLALAHLLREGGDEGEEDEEEE